nr:MAG TPA: Terminase small subunit [Caudoviricetes sp.]DAP41803.1 MAG TPA: Terminase small subunit [Caudoviricetes sp.]
MKLNARQKSFCEFYVASGNATESAIKARYSEKTARSIGQRLLTNVDIKKYIKELQEKAKESRILTAREKREWLSEVIKNGNEKLQDRLKALDILNRMDGDYVEKVQLSGEVKRSNPFEGLTTKELKKLANGK